MPRKPEEKICNGRIRHWTGVLNNWTQEEYNMAKAAIVDNCTWGIICKEIGKKKGQPHLHIGMSFPNARTMMGVKRLLGSNRWAKVYKVISTCEKYREYCMKDGDYWEHGKCPEGQGTRGDLGQVREWLQEGKTDQWIVQNVTNMQQANYLKTLRTYETRDKVKPKVLWYCGVSGSGKSHDAKHYEEEKSRWTNHGRYDWFDGYEGQDIVIFDELRPEQCKFTWMLRLLDKYPLKVKVHNGFTDWTPKTIIITTTKRPEDLWAERTDEETFQLLRRIDIIKTYTERFQGDEVRLPEEHDQDGNIVYPNQDSYIFG